MGLSKEEHSTRTIRIDSGLDEVLREEAEKKNQSVNNIIEGLITEYVHNGRYFEDNPLLMFSPSTFSSLLTQMDDDSVFEAGREAGKINARNNLLVRGLPINYASLKWFIIEVLDGHVGWFNCNFHEMEGEHMFHLRHNLDKKWSYFVDAYVEAMVESLLDLEVDAEILDGTVTLRIPVKKT